MSNAPRLRKVGRPRSDDVGIIREDILAAARRLFFEHGIADTGMDAIAKAAGVTKQTLYARFSNKSELCEAVMDDIMREWRDHQGPLLGSFVTLEETLFQHTVKTLDTATRGGSALLAQFLNKESRFQPDLTKEILGSIRARGIQDIQTILEAFPVPAPSAVSVERSAEFYFMLLVGKINDLNTLPGEADLDDLASWARTAVRLFLDGHIARS
jgi:AcrR family transcriptional regulator